MAEAARNLSEHDSITEALRLARISQQQGSHADAERLYAAVLAAVPDHFEALRLAAELKQLRGEADQALTLITHALTIEARSPEAWTSHGLILHGNGRHEEALASFDRALSLKSDHVPAFNQRGVALCSLGRVDEAILSFDCALAVKQDDVDALNNRASACVAVGRASEALATSERVLAIRPGHFEALVGRGNALAALGRHDEAIASLDRAAMQRPYHYGVQFRRAESLHALRRLDDALAAYDRVLALQPFHAGALNGRGIILYALGRDEQALACFREISSVQSNFPEARCNEGRALLRMGELEQGWRLLETRSRPERGWSQPRWRGDEPVADRVILLHAEQDLADTIQLVRYAPLLAGQGASVVLEAQAQLLDVLRHLDGVGSVVAAGAPLPHFDLHCPLWSLPFCFKTGLETIPANVPYLAADPVLVGLWRERLPAGRRVGVAWRGLDAAALATLADVADVSLISLEPERHGVPAGILPPGPDGLADVAAIIASLDLVIATDGAAAHLAGALGKPVWLLLPVSAHFRWLEQRGDSPWYPTARLFRQSSRDDWDGVIARVREELRALP